jgi:hypothetical protein
MGVFLTNDTVQPATPYQVGLHYLTGTSRHSLEAVKAYLSSLLGASEFAPTGYGGNSYQHTLRSILDAKIYYTDGREDILVWLPGRVCEFLGHSGLICIIEHLELSCTRLDIAFDGHDISPMLLQQTWLDGNVNTRVRRESVDFRHEGVDVIGNTFYIGSKKSERVLCAYDRRGFNRLEFRVRGEMAYNLSQSFLMLHDEPDRVSLVLGMLRAWVDFVDRSVDVNPTRCPQLPWWSSFLNSAEKFRFHKEKKEEYVLDYVANVIKRYSGSFSTAVDMISIQTGKNPLDVITELYFTGKSRQTSRHKWLVKQFGSLEAHVPF